MNGESFLKLRSSIARNKPLNFFNFKSNNSQKIATPPVTITPSYNVAAGFLASSALLFAGFHSIFLSAPVFLVSILLFVQTGRVRFVFDQEALQIFVGEKSDSPGEEVLKSSGENFAVGGENRWKYDSFTKWFFIPSKEFPILMYFKENQTSEKGQLHLFPVIMDGKMLYNTMVERIGEKA